MVRPSISHGPDVAAVAALIAEPSRAALLTALLGGVARPAGELARCARISAPTASGHLAKLVRGGLLRVTTSGRHRYYALAGEPVARLLESLALVAPPPPASDARAAFALRRLRQGRTCYDHLAGALGVSVTDALVAHGHLDPHDDAYALTDSGAAWMEQLGVECAALQRQRRAFVRACLDWSERRPHLAGALGAAITSRLFELHWIARADDTRAVVTTPIGRRALRRELGVVAVA